MNQIVLAMLIPAMPDSPARGPCAMPVAIANRTAGPGATAKPVVRTTKDPSRAPSTGHAAIQGGADSGPGEIWPREIWLREMRAERSMGHG